MLTHLDIPYPRTPILDVLLDILKAQGLDVPMGVDEAFTLAQYALQTRYPGDWEPVTHEETQQALERAVLVLSWVGGQIQG